MWNWESELSQKSKHSPLQCKRTFLTIQKSAWKSPRLQQLKKREYKKINIHVMPFKSLINIRSICPLAGIQRPVNANEWESKAIRVHYRVPLVSTAASLRLSTDGPCKRQTHNSKISCTLNDRWDTCAFCVSREKKEHNAVTGMDRFSFSRGGRKRFVLRIFLFYSWRDLKQHYRRPEKISTSMLWYCKNNYLKEIKKCVCTGVREGIKFKRSRWKEAIYGVVIIQEWAGVHYTLICFYIFLRQI